MIYYVEDDSGIRELVVYTLQSTGFAARGFDSGAALFAALDTPPELILLDLMLPDQDGLTILARLKKDPATAGIPVIILSAKGAEYDKVVGLDRGADDYLAKPFGMMELVSRVRAVLRRRGVHPAPSAGEEWLRAGDIRLCPDRHIARVGERELSLTLKEFSLLQCLMENRGIVLSRDRLLERVWGYDYGGETRTVDAHVRSLRQKLDTAADMLETVRGVGYRVVGGAED